MSDPTNFDPSNAGYVQALWEEFSRNPESIPPEWRDYFARGPQLPASDGLIPPDGIAGDGRGAPVPEAAATTAVAPPAPSVPTAPPVAGTPATLQDTLAHPEGRRLLKAVAQATALVQALRDHGHQLARIDPLGSEPPGHPQLDPQFFGLSSEDLQQIPASVVVAKGGEEGLADTLARLREVYCGSIGYEFEHMGDPEKVRWLWDEVESGRHTEALSDARKVALLERLTHVEGMERFLHRAYLGQKRFSIEGTDMMVPMLDVAVEEVGRRGGHEVIIGMAHRGRLNVLAHILGADYREFLRSFENLPHGETTLTIPEKGTGDVKYHHGARGQYQLPEGGTLTVSLTPNPSHLEFVDPVVAGYARVRQFEDGSADVTRDPRAVVPVLIHGDAAFAGEGVVAETLNMARLEGYDVGGTIHIIANNQVGFTTDPTDSRSTNYASDLAKGFDIPILHVNADDPEACVAAVKLAMAFRDRFEDDVVIDLVGYRRHGHNEGDEPGYTQPALYKRIGAHPTVRTIWARRLVDDGVVSEEAAEEMESGFQEMMRDAQDEVRGEATEHGPDRHLDSPDECPDPNEIETGIPMEVLAEVNRASVAVPDGFTVHPKLKRQLDRRSGDFDEDTSLDWAQGEALALGTLLKEGVPIRMTGQDVERGTFSHRHVVLHDVETGETVTPLGRMGGARFEIYNSPLTETAVLGFEYGYSVGAEKDLVLWEAQFGDFVNVGQVVIDQFIAAGEAKWGLHSNLTLLLPHGYEGQGPEHSSARLERFLQLCAENNMRVVYPSTPAQYFHLLRRQAMMRPARPLVVMTPKSLLRHPQAVSSPSELAKGRFQPVVQDPGALQRAGDVQRIVLSSGKVYYDLLALRDSEDMESVALVRLEELYPFPAAELRETLSAYPAVKEIWWAQEEPRNMGALSFIGPRLRAVVPRTIPLKHASRPDRASPAEGSSRDHTEEQTRLVRTALGLEGEGSEED
jgi:2-oxoglutarate dehydrogenase E1 component